MKTVSPLNDHMILDAPEPEDHQPPDGDCRASVCSLRVALKEIANQMLTDEMEPAMVKYADWKGGYEAIVKIARKALAENKEIEDA